MPAADSDNAGYVAAWRPALVPAEAAAFARAAVTGCGPLGRDRAKNLLWAAGKLAGYGIGLGLEPVPHVLLHPSAIERFTAHAPGLSGPARRTLRTNLRFIARRVVPHLDPADVAAAERARRTYQKERGSTTLARQHLASVLLVTALPIRNGRTILGAVRITQAVSTIHAAVRQTIIVLGLIGLVVLALGLSAGTFIAGQIVRPLRRLERVARQIAGGDMTARATVEGSSEQRSLGESFNEMTDRIVRLLDSQRAFVADASHQLRTPLTGLRLRLDEARASGVSGDAAHELDAAAAEVDRFAQVIDELLVLSRAGERELPGERIDLDDVAADAVDRWRRIADEREITLEHVRHGPGGVVWCSPADVERALDALIENALRYSPRDSTVTIAVRTSGLDVLDTGPGVADDEREIVFERFHRGRAGRAGPPGTGLGLAIARELARGWGGDVTLDNRPAGGAVAELRLRTPP